MAEIDLAQLARAINTSPKPAYQIAEEVGIDGPTLSKWKTGERTVPDSRVYRLAMSLDVSLEFLFGLTEMDPEHVVVPTENTRPEKQKIRKVISFGMDGMPMLPSVHLHIRCSCGKVVNP